LIETIHESTLENEISGKDRISSIVDMYEDRSDMFEDLKGSGSTIRKMKVIQPSCRLQKNGINLNRTRRFRINIHQMMFITPTVFSNRH